MHEQRRAGAQRCLRLGQSGGVDDERQVVLARFVARRGDGGGRRFDRQIWRLTMYQTLTACEPCDGEIAHAVARRRLVVEDDELPLGGKVEPVIERRQQRTGGDDVRHVRVRARSVRAAAASTA